MSTLLFTKIVRMKLIVYYEKNNKKIIFMYK